MSQANFADLNLSKELLRAVSDLGFEEPSPIQALAIPHILSGRDVVGQAQTGTGKTAAFSLPVLNLLELRKKKPQALVLCPTRELAVQVANEVASLAAHLQGFSVLPVYGGQSLERQIKTLQRGVQFVVGTPGRVIDHLERGTLKLDNLRVLVLDEADEMLDMGFREDMERVLQEVPEHCQKVCFSATMPSDILALVKSYMQEPEFVKVTRKELTVPNIEQFYYEVRPHQKNEVLALVLESQNLGKGIVFCSTKRGVDELATLLLARGFQADALHGNLSQNQRDRVMERFRKGGLDLLIATDVAARGLDIDDVDVVINFDIPYDVENYVHRIGRTGRAGRAGRALTFVTPREQYRLKDIARYTKANIQRAEVPSRREVSDRKTARLLSELRENIEAARADSLSGKKMDRFALLLDSVSDDDTSSLEMAAALLKMLMERENILSAEAEAQREEAERRKARSEKTDRKSGKPKSRQGRDRSMERLFFNVGSKSKITPRDIVGAITGECGLPGKVIGSIEIYDRFTFVEVPSEYADEVVNVMNQAKIRGLKLGVEIARPQKHNN